MTDESKRKNRYEVNYHDFLEQVKDEINSVSPSFCLAKWLHVTMHLHTGYTHSCYHPGPHKIPLEELRENPGALHNTKWKKEQRKKMLEGERPDECRYCWQVEDLGDDQISDRHLRSSEIWAHPYLDYIKNLPWDADVYPHYLEISFGNECQFKCSYCAPSASSSWFNETKKYGDYPLKHNTNRGQYNIDNFLKPGELYKEEDNPYIDAFWKWLPDAYPHVKTLRVTGGEPLLQSNVFKLLDYINENPRPDMEFNINSNMGIPRRNLDKFITQVNGILSENKIRHFRMYTSVDTWGPQAEWMRNGLDIKTFEDNIRHYLDSVPGSKISFMVTFNAMAIPRFNEFLEKILELRNDYSHDYQRVTFDTPYMVEPPHLTACILDETWHDKLKEHLDWMGQHVEEGNFKKFTTVEWKKLERAWKWIKDNQYQQPELDKHRADFFRFINEHDRRRKTNWHEAFPEMVPFYNKCKEIAELQDIRELEHYAEKQRRREAREEQ